MEGDGVECSVVEWSTSECCSLTLLLSDLNLTRKCSNVVAMY